MKVKCMKRGYVCLKMCVQNMHCILVLLLKKKETHLSFSYIQVALCMHIFLRCLFLPLAMLTFSESPFWLAVCRGKRRSAISWRRWSSGWSKWVYSYNSLKLRQIHTVCLCWVRRRHQRESHSTFDWQTLMSRARTLSFYIALSPETVVNKKHTNHNFSYKLTTKLKITY